MLLSPTFCHFISPWCKHSPQHPALKHYQSMFLPLNLIYLASVNPSTGDTMEQVQIHKTCTIII
jgi:hypothetical protein